MKSTLLFLLLIFLSVKLSCINFEQVYPLGDIGDVTDQVMVRSPNGDDYFFFVESEKLFIKRRLSDTDVFTDYYLDWGIYDFNQIFEVESVQLSNNENKIFIVSRDVDEYGIYLLTFNKNNIEIKKNIYRSANKICDLLAENYQNDTVLMGFSESNRLQIGLFDTRDKLLLFKHSIKDKFHNLKIYLNHTDDLFSPHIFFFSELNGLITLWFLNIRDQDITAQFIKELTNNEVENFIRDERYISSGYFTRDDFDTLFRIVEDQCYFIVLKSNYDLKYSLTSDKITPYIITDHNVFNVDNFSLYKNSLVFDNSLIYIDDELKIETENNLIKVSSKKSQYLINRDNYYDLLLFNRFLITVEEISSRYILDINYFDDRSLLNISSAELVEPVVLSRFYPILCNGYLTLSGSNIIISLETFNPYIIDGPFEKHSNYIYLKDENGKAFLGVDR